MCHAHRSPIDEAICDTLLNYDAVEFMFDRGGVALARSIAGGCDRSRPRLLLMSENPEIEIDLIYQLLRMAVKLIVEGL